MNMPLCHPGKRLGGACIYAVAEGMQRKQAERSLRWRAEPPPESAIRGG
jgi:hypothetical protein